MYWNEYINLIKQKYTEDEFSVPHVDRKNILKNIETRFINRKQDYYDLNNFSDRFCNWWDNLNVSLEIKFKVHYHTVLNSIIDPKDQFWTAYEFEHEILLYKSKLNAIIHLSSIGQSWTKTFHLIHLKYEYLIGFKIDNAGTTLVKVFGNKKLEEKLKNMKNNNGTIIK